VTIPSRLLNPTTQSFIKTYFPATSVNAPINASNGRLVDFFENRSGLLVRDLATLRVDHDFSARDKIAVVYNTQYTSNANAAVVSPYVGLGLTQNDGSNHTVSLSYTRIIKPNVVNEAAVDSTSSSCFATAIPRQHRSLRALVLTKATLPPITQ
jgi:hypothetical protein